MSKADLTLWNKIKHDVRKAKLNDKLVDCQSQTWKGLSVLKHGFAEAVKAL